jgi:alkanesulfonate monooxygenase SsuD/methylene tetrahydromethanopterin reductase-like flavin-dependent oxidoreductase (luciferase family)
VPETWARDALTPLAYLAGQTTAIGLGSSVVHPGARSPAILAVAAMSLQLLSGGRFLLGVIGTTGELPWAAGGSGGAFQRGL